MTLKDYSDYQFLLVEPVAKTAYPPLGLMKISSMLKDKYKGCTVFTQVGNGIPDRLSCPKRVFITSLFTWDWKFLVGSIDFYKRVFPSSEIMVGGISASLLNEDLQCIRGITPCVGLYNDAEFYPPDYSIPFGRRNRASITFTSRGCNRKCEFCSVRVLEPDYFVKDDWQKDIVEEFPFIIFWDNNFLYSPNFEKDCQKILQLGKKVDFNQGLDARLLDEHRAKRLFNIDIDPIRLAFDDVRYERAVVKAIRLARKYSNREIMVYVLYNFKDTPEDLYYRIDLLNREGVLSFPMEYRAPNKRQGKIPGPHWNTFLLRAFKLTLLFYYNKGVISRSRTSFERIYGKTANEFVSRLYEIFRYDKALKRTSKVEEPILYGR